MFVAELMEVNQGQTSQGGPRARCGRMEVAHMQIGYSSGLLRWGGGVAAPPHPSAGMLIYEKPIYRGSCLFYLQRLEGNDAIIYNRGLLQPF